LDTIPRPGYRILTGRYVFHYHIGPEPSMVGRTLPFMAISLGFAHQVLPTGWIYGWDLSTTLGRQEFVLLQRIYTPWPWV
jgi:hypothetical protein